MECSRISLLLIFLISAVPRRSHQSFDHAISPSPAPLPWTSSPAPESLNCDHVSNKCQIQNCSLTACVPFLGSQTLYIVILNGGETSLQLNIVVLPANMTLDSVVSEHQVKKVDLPSNTRGDSSILLSVGDGECSIHLGSLIPQAFYPSYITPLHGIYILFAATLSIGGSWACCRLAKRRGRLDGVPYHELEMDQRESDQGWGQNWDEEWDDEENGVRSPATIHTRKVPLSSM
ncbi:uncharacterized protein LOC131020056 [Salvia miltiorrhiza]|uniref:uncharacterized protein LOC131020056 n=1 Tax=Salvia miltiorrhiza TaxID=226208 RepID=UPI0025AD11E5|nr:uncharacterized protein LOC131020056 [Salvia miltiorrhiza]